MEYYQMMINNAKSYIKNVDPLNEDCIDAFRISEVLALCTGRLKEDILLELLNKNYGIN